MHSLNFTGHLGRNDEHYFYVSFTTEFEAADESFV